MLQRIVVPIDGSADSEKALAIAEYLAAQQDAEIALVRVVESLPWLAAAEGELTTIPEVYDKLIEEADRDARGSLARLAEHAQAKNVRVSTTILNGSPAAALLDWIDEQRPDLVVMATHGRTGLARFALGSVTDRIVREGCAPVLVIRRTSPEVGALDRALVTLDGSAVAEEALPMVHALACRPVRSVQLLRAVSAPADCGAATAYLEGVAVRLEATGVKTDVLVEVGAPTRLIEHAAQAADVVILCTHGRSGLDRLRHGSVAEYVVRHVEKPALLVRAGSLARSGT